MSHARVSSSFFSTKHLVKGRETARAEFPSESWESVGEIKERQLGSSVKSRLESRNRIFHARSLCPLVSLVSSPRRRRIPSPWRRARSDASVSQYSYICRPINEIRIALIIRDTFPSPAGGVHLGSFSRLQRERVEPPLLASVPPLSLPKLHEPRMSYHGQYIARYNSG